MANIVAGTKYIIVPEVLHSITMYTH